MLLILSFRIPPASLSIPYTTLFRSGPSAPHQPHAVPDYRSVPARGSQQFLPTSGLGTVGRVGRSTGKEHTTSIPDRKSTRLNSSHLVISYAVFCLKKKKTTATSTT